MIIMTSNKNNMKRIMVTMLAVTLCMGWACSLNNNIEPVDYVDPLIGSGGHGHVFVGANVPFGAVQVGPNNIYKGWWKKDQEKKRAKNSYR